MPEFTPEQKRVICHEKGNLLVSAAAGSGKTAVLVERILHLVQGGADIASFLIVTFTRAAADELRGRLTQRLEEAAQGSEEMRLQAERVELASISTIHAFCLQTLTRYFERAGMEPNLRICGEAERVILQQRAMDEVLDAAYLDGQTAARMEKLGSPDQARTNISALYRFAMNQPDPAGWLERSEKLYDAYAENPEESPLVQGEQERARVPLRRLIAQVRTLLDGVKKSSREDVRKMEGLIAGDLAGLELYEKGKLTAVTFERWKAPFKRGESGSGEYLNLQSAREEIKEQYKKIAENSWAVTDWERQKCLEMRDTVHLTAELVRRFRATFDALKADAGVIDYGDMEQKMLEMTKDSQICDELRAKYAYIFVDEYQDSSAVQETILQRIARGDNTFHVGDIKQSIYGFRQSDPALFLSETERYKAGQGGSLITLNRNFRSLENVLYCTNRVFESCMKKESAGMDYDADAMLYPGRSGEGMGGGAPTILQLVDRKAEPDPETGLEYENAKGEAVAAARLVRRLLGTPVSDGKGGTRPARYADIVVLRRSVAGVLPQYLEAFGKLGIPVYSSKGGSFYRTQEILQALDMLWAVHNPLEDVHLLGALHGAGGFSAQEIARVRLCGREKGAQDGSGEGRRLWTCLIDYKNDPDDEALGARVSEFVDLVVRLRRISRQESVATLCGVMLEETGMMEACAAMPRGQIRLANLRSLPVRAAEYDASGLRLGDFLRRIKDTGERNREEDVPVFSDKDDVVRIMTVHQSKGLQFPIVIGTGLGTRFKLGNAKSEDGVLTSRLWCDKDEGFALEYYDPEKAAVDNTLLTRAIAAQRRRDSIAEEMRILYVLMTRAQDRLALVGEINDLKGKELKIWQHDGDEPARMLDWIMPALRDHPDGKKLIWGDLWDFLELQERPDASRWEISASMDAQDAQQEGADEQEQPDAQREEVLPDEKLMAQLRYRYPYPESTVQRKQSVTDLAHGAEQSFFIKESPAFLTKDKKLRGAQRGSAIHRFMQIADFSAFAAAQDRRAELEKQANAAAQSLRMTREQADAVMDGAEEALRFLDSETGRAILSGCRVLREKPFEIRMDEDGQMRLVQGVIDLMVLTESGAVLVDYKTDHTGLSEGEVRAKHGLQVNLYRQAAERAGIAVERCEVYLFFTGKSVEIRPGDGERKEKA